MTGATRHSRSAANCGASAPGRTAAAAAALALGVLALGILATATFGVLTVGSADDVRPFRSAAAERRDAAGGPLVAAGAIRDRLDALEATIETIEENRESLDRQLGDTVEQLSRGLRNAADAAAALDAVTLRVNGIETRVAALLDREAHLKRTLRSKTRSIGRLTRPMLTAARAPMPVSLSATSDPLAAARSAMIVGSVMAEIERDAAVLRTEIDDLARLSALLEEERRALARGGRQEAERLADLEDAIAEKRTAVGAMVDDRSAANGRLEDLSDLTAGLEAAIDELENEAQRVRNARVRRDALERSAAAPNRAYGGASTGAAATGDDGAGFTGPGANDGAFWQALLPTGVHLPAVGPIVAAFGETDRFGDPFPGMRIRADSDGAVVAPLAGTVKFSGEFGGYGQLLIIEHGGGYHSLIAGLGSFVTSAGTSVAAGEILGAAPKPHNGQTQQPDIYFEVRQDGLPIAPIEGLVRAQERGRG